MLSENICSSEPRRSFPESSRWQTPSWPWNHKVDLKYWHLVVYNGNKSPGIGPWRETGVLRSGPSHPWAPNTPTKAKARSPRPRRAGVSPNEGGRPCHSSFFNLGPTFSGSDCGRLLPGISPQWPLKGQGLRIPEKLMGSLWVLNTCW